MKSDQLFKGLAVLLLAVPVLIVHGETVLALLFPPKMGRINARLRYQPTGDFLEEDLGDGIVWRAYDVRASGIEKHFWRASKRKTL